MPDRMIITANGVVGFLEIKRRGQKPTPLQMIELQKLKAMKCNVGWCDNVLDGEQFIRLLCKEWDNKPFVYGRGLV